ncbi:MAG TPA: citrate/2-methylcitrate synthase [Pseudonocardiaceae bacterium]|jgi:citrate synthase
MHRLGSTTRCSATTTSWRELHPNVNFCTGRITGPMGFPIGMFGVLSALVRLLGWIALCREMISDPRTKIDNAASGLHRAGRAAVHIDLHR